MDNLKHEINENYEVFRSNWKTQLDETFEDLGLDQNKYKISNKRLVSLQAWKTELLENILSPDVLEFYIEAQNGAILSHIFANIGTWRAALRSLRCCVDNPLFCLYYKDHPVEFRLWQSGKEIKPFSEFFNYLKKHPDIVDMLFKSHLQ